ncbi:hypothetical protein [Microbacterium rhizomatis]|uniref:Uncharacterized protein n=1 Tax=Microbacterium rhizomatis TaxID=1631477 RepID=A0A5J5J396_9MICO|nr:hypothetical protein [Microbacterium rhizomatis]KAA9110442.1 hypothetical protein F6B43_01770 [Microbacterium rhizomatis]
MNQQTDNQPLTRKQMREIRNTASNPIVTGDGPGPQEETAGAADSPTTDAAVPTARDASEESPAADAVPVAPLARAAEPVVVAPAPAPDASVDLGVSPLTRRQARQQERIRTASVPVITPEVLAASAAAAPAVPADRPLEVADSTSEDSTPDAAAEVFAEAPEADRPIVNPQFGSELLSGEPVTSPAVPASFDQLIARESAASGSIATPNALILSQGEGAPLMSPIAATGEVLITGTFALPEGLGSQGHVPGAADGREADAVLIDGELPAHSSPTPIAASAAISTVKTNGEIIRPPAPEKGNRLMLTLAITAGVLALALVGVLILAFATGVFR